MLKQKQPDFSIEDLLALFPEINTEKGASTAELMAAKGRCREWVLRWLRPLIRSGQIVLAWRKTTDILGRNYNTPVWTIKK